MALNIVSVALTRFIRGRDAFRAGVNVETLSANKTLHTQSARFQKLTAATTDRDLLMPDEALTKGWFFRVHNAGGSNSIVVKEHDGTALPGGALSITPGQARNLVNIDGVWTEVGQ
jgi:hypothetical protein